MHTCFNTLLYLVLKCHLVSCRGEKYSETDAVTHHSSNFPVPNNKSNAAMKCYTNENNPGALKLLIASKCGQKRVDIEIVKGSLKYFFHLHKMYQ